MLVARIVMLFGTKVETDQSLCTNEISKGKASLGRSRDGLEYATKKLEFVVYKFPKYGYLDLCSWNDGLFSNRFCEFSRQKAR